MQNDVPNYFASKQHKQPARPQSRTEEKDNELRARLRSEVLETKLTVAVIAVSHNRKPRPIALCSTQNAETG